MNLGKIFLWPMAVVHDNPVVALWPMLLFAAAAIYYLRRGVGKVALIICASLAWGCFTAYSIRMRAWEMTITGPIIRVDLLLLAPILYIVTIAGVFQILFKSRNRNVPRS